MKILCFSDSHGRVLSMYEAVQAEQPDVILHAGDSEDSFETLEELLQKEQPHIECRGVLGNCDRDQNLASRGLHQRTHTELLTVSDKRVLLLHSHQFPELRMRGDYSKALAFARERRADMLVFGHTHRQERLDLDGVVFVNPGATQWGDYAVIDISDSGEISVRLVQG